MKQPEKPKKSDAELTAEQLRRLIKKNERELAILRKKPIDRRTDAEKIAAIFISAWDKAVAMAHAEAA